MPLILLTAASIPNGPNLRSYRSSQGKGPMRWRSVLARDQVPPFRLKIQAWISWELAWSIKNLDCNEYSGTCQVLPK